MQRARSASGSDMMPGLSRPSGACVSLCIVNPIILMEDPNVPKGS